MSISYSSVPNASPPSWHRAAASLSSLASSLPFQLQQTLGLSIWSTPGPREDIPDIVLIPPTPERPVISASREENKRLTERFFSGARPQVDPSSPPRPDPHNLLPLPYARRRPRRDENKENASSSPATPAPPRPALQKNNPFAAPRLTRPPSAAKCDTLPRHSKNPYRAGDPPGLRRLTSRPQHTSPTQERRRPASIAGCPKELEGFSFLHNDDPRVHGRAPGSEVQHNEEGVERLVTPLDFCSENERAGARQRGRQLTPAPAHQAPADPQHASRPANFQGSSAGALPPSLRGSPPAPKNPKGQQGRALRERTNISDDVRWQGTGSVVKKANVDKGSMDLERVKRIWEDWDWVENPRPAYRNALITNRGHGLGQHPPLLGRQRGPERTKSASTDDWREEERFVIGEWDEEDVWEDCSF